MKAVAGAACWALAAVVAAPSALAQAWAPRAGEGSVTLAFQGIDNTGHVLSDGSSVPVGKSRNASIYVEAEYAVTDRVSFSAGIPFVFAQYRGPRPPPGEAEPPMVQPVDACYCWQDGLQDLGLTSRFNLLNGATAISASLSLGAPSHDYEYRGEAVVGRNLRELRLALDVGQRLDFLSRRLAVQGRYSYAVVEEVLDVSTNRSNASAEVLYQVTDGLSVEVAAFWQITHGGLRAGLGPPPEPDGIPWGEITTPEQFREHDRLMRDDYWRLGASLTYSFPRVDLFAAYVEFVGGSDTHDGRALTVGISVPFGR